MMINSQPLAAAAPADDDDFRDVFGGPPRRTIIRRRTRRGRSGEDQETNNSGRENEDHSSPWHPKSSEQPVFGGGEGAIRNPRRYLSKDFFDDIFRGDDSFCSTPNKAVDRDPFSSAPGSRTLSPSRPLQPADDPDPSCLPKKLTKEVEFGSVITSSNRGSTKGKDSASNAVGYAYSLSNLSRFSSQSVHSQEKTRNEFGVLYCESPLSRSLRVTKSDETVVDLKKSSGVSDACIRDSKFHFSIFKWVSKGIPSLRPLRGVRSLGSEKKGRSEKTSSSNGSIENCSVNELYTTNMHGKGFNTENCVECKNQGSYSFLKEKPTSTGDGEEEQCEIIEEAFLSMLETETSKRLSNFVEAAAVNGMCHNTREEAGPHSLPQISVCGEKNEVSMPEVDDDERKISDLRETKNRVRKIVEEKYINMESQENVKTSDEKEVDRASMGDLPTKSIGTVRRNRSEGKVRNFVKMFNQEASLEPEINHDLQRRSSKWKSKDGVGVEKQADFHKMRTDGKMQNHSVDQKKAMPDGFIAFEGHFKPMTEQHSDVKNTIHEYIDTSYGGNYSLASVSVPDGSEAAFGMGESFEENLVVLSEDQNLGQTSEVNDEIQASDVRIQLWANGKEGNIRSLLSTLQFVLWPESGWKTVALVDIIEVNAVRRAYQKALLCLHPDKLQQKGAASHQKYIAEKIFDILQDAWTHFNSLGSL